MQASAMHRCVRTERAMGGYLGISVRVMFLDRRVNGIVLVYVGIHNSCADICKTQACVKASQEFSRLPNVFRHKDHTCAESMLGRSRVN